jgi:hypothetical protein
MFFNLYQYEMRKIKNENIILLTAIFLLNIFTTYKYFNDVKSMAPIVFNMISMVAIFLIPLTSFTRSLTQEFKDNSIYLMRSLPISSYKNYLSKQLAALSQYLLLTITVGILSGLQLYFLIIKENVNITELMTQQGNFMYMLGEAIKFTSIAYITSILIVLLFLNVIFLATIIGKSIKKYYRLVSFTSTLFIMYVISKIFSLFNKFAFNFISTGTTTHTQFIPISFIIIDLLVFLTSAGLFYIACRIYDKKVNI